MIIIAGKSCAGKTTVAGELGKLGYTTIVSYTTRPPREGEVEGIAYHFVSKEDFLRKTEEGFFAETRSFNVACGESWYYGTAKEDLSEEKVAVLNPDGVRKLKQMPEINPVVFLIKVDDELLLKRMTARGQDMKEGMRRIKSDIEDFRDMDSIADYIVYNTLDITPAQLAETISRLYRNHQAQHSA